MAHLLTESHPPTTAQCVPFHIRHPTSDTDAVRLSGISISPRHADAAHGRSPFRYGSNVTSSTDGDSLGLGTLRDLGPMGIADSSGGGAHGRFGIWHSHHGFKGCMHMFAAPPYQRYIAPTLPSSVQPRLSVPLWRIEELLSACNLSSLGWGAGLGRGALVAPLASQRLLPHSTPPLLGTQMRVSASFCAGASGIFVCILHRS